MIHELKTWSKYFTAINSGQKKFELRLNNRNFQTGDTLLLHETKDDTNTYTGNFCLVHVDYILEGIDFGITKGYCIMSISKYHL